MAVDASRPFPLIRNKTLNIAALLSKKKGKAEKEEIEFATVQVPSVLPTPGTYPFGRWKVCPIAVSEMNDTTAALNAFSFDKETGKLSLLNRQPTMGADPCYVATNRKRSTHSQL